jgi:hypothetical protein
MVGGWGGQDVHECTPDIFRWDHAFFLVCVVVVFDGEEVEGLFDLCLFFPRDIVFLGQF